MMPLNYPLLLKNSQMHYSWGAENLLTQLFDLPPAPYGVPQAEIWMGAHPKAPSFVLLKTGQFVSLLDLIKQYPQAIYCKKFRTFPLLFKLLAANQPLSIQVHPNKIQAVKGYAQENAHCPSLPVAQRNYRDPNHKLELLYALTPFRALCGFRPMEEIEHYLTILLNEIALHPTHLKKNISASERLRSLFTWTLAMEGNEKRKIMDKMIALSHKKTGDTAFDNIAYLHQYHPNDSAIFTPLWLNTIHLNPGETLFIQPGCPHAYLHGAGMEIMTNSDNVLRGGLTNKYVDLVELYNVTCFTSTEVKQVTQIKPIVHNDITLFPIPSEDFYFALFDIQRPWQRTPGTMQIIFCTQGFITLSGGGVHLPIKKGDACLLPLEAHLFLKGKGVLAMVGTHTQDIKNFQYLA